MDWDKVILRLNRCGRSLWPVGHALTRDWFASRVVDYVFWFIWQGNGVLQEGPKRVRRLRRGVCLLMRPGVRFEVRQEGDSQLGVNFIHFTRCSRR